MKQNRLTEKSYEDLEKRIYNISDLVLILRTYCSHNGKNDEKINYIDTVLLSISCELDKIALRF